jgi:hypothetical protein
LIESWLLAPYLGDPKPEEEPVKHKQGGDPAVLVRILVTGHEGFLVMKPADAEIRREFIDQVCEYLYGADCEWCEAIC